MKYFTITVNGTPYSVTVEETAAGAAPVAAAPAAPAPAPKVAPAPAAAEEIPEYVRKAAEITEAAKASGTGAKKTLQGRDQAEVYVILQKRWEDAKGNIHALRVGTGRERFNKSIPLTKVEYGIFTTTTITFSIIILYHALSIHHALEL